MKTQILTLLLLVSGISLWADEPKLSCNTEITNFHYQTEQITSCLCPGPLSLVLYWDEVAEDYQIEYGKQGFQRDEGRFIQSTRELPMNAIFPYDLEEYTLYDIYIRTKCGDGFGEWYKFAFETTDIHSSIEQNEGQKFSIYPNPVDHILYIDFSSVHDRGNMHISILDMSGVLCKEFKYQDEYDLSTLPSGAYLVKVADGTFVETQIIQKK